MGLFGPSKEEKEKAAAKLQADLEASKNVKVTTGGINKDYEILKIVFELGQDQGGLLGMAFGTGGSPEQAFENAEAQLKIKAAKLGCDYVINTVFNQRIAVGKTITGDANQVIEVFAYGTAIKSR
tara:strand:- start:5044 stop:5418 length:375 start_codon:yes stop_codon:yes gene_type:complete